MRGKATIIKWFVCCGGITPAHAGKSPPPFFLEFHIWDHPRACGEKRSIASQRPSTSGSPPRMRGKVLSLVGDEGLLGITPAYAGKSKDL